MRTHATLLVLLLALSSPPARAAEEKVTLKWGEVSLSERLRLPYLRVAVGPETPLKLAGRERPVTFEIRDGEIFADADGEQGCELRWASGKTFAVALDGGRALRLAMLTGDPGAGEPRAHVVSTSALSGRIGGTPVRFFDYDADGTFLTPWRDYLDAGKKGSPRPVAPVVVLGRHAFRMEAHEAEGKIRVSKDEEYTSRDVFPRWTDVADGLDRLNEIRGAMNLPPVALNREGSRGALLHLIYCERNGGNGHIERWDFPGYTKEGAMAGLNAIGWIGGGSVTSAIEGHLGSLLHRMELIDPRLTQVGFASKGSRIWIHTECGEKRPFDGQGPVIFPGPDRAWRSGAYTGDNPDPRPEDYHGGSGLPVTCAWYGTEKVREVRAELFYGSNRVKCLKNDADGRELRSAHAPLRAVLMPINTLKGGKLVLTWKQDDRPCRLEYRFQIR